MNFANKDVIAVHVTNIPEASRKDRTSTFNTANLTANVAARVLGHAPNRRRAVLTIVGQSTDVAYVCGSEADCYRSQGAIVMGVQVVELTGADEVWVISATAIAVGVVAEFAPSGA